MQQLFTHNRFWKETKFPHIPISLLVWSLNNNCKYLESNAQDSNCTKCAVAFSKHCQKSDFNRLSFVWKSWISFTQNCECMCVKEIINILIILLKKFCLCVLGYVGAYTVNDSHAASLGNIAVWISWVFCVWLGGSCNYASQGSCTR